MKKQIPVTIVAVLLVFSLFVGCTSGSQDASKLTDGSKTPVESVAGDASNKVEPLTEIPLPIVTDETKLTIYVELDVVDFSAYANLSENPISQEFMKLTGLKLEFQHPPAGQGKEHFNIMVAGGEVPDITFGMFESYYQGGSEQAFKDGIIIDPAPYIANYAPNFNRLIMTDDLARKIVHNDSGFLTGFGGTISFDAPLNGGNVYGGPMVRKDLLEKAKLEAPVTVDDWTAMLREFKKLGVKYPYGWAHNGKDWDPLASDSTFAMAWDIPARGFYPDDGAVKFAPMEANYKNYLDLLRSWYAEGFINPDFATQTYLEHLKYQCQMGEVGATDHHIFEYGSLSESIDKGGFTMVPVPQPVLKEGQKLRLKTDWGWDVGREGKYISKSCKTPEIAVQFIDWLYTEQAKELSNWGIEGVSFTKVDNKYSFTPMLLQEDPNFEKNTRLYCPNVWKQNVSDEMNQLQYKLPVQKEAFKLWGNSDAFDIEGNHSLKFPLGFGALPPEEGTRYSELMAVINPYVQEMLLKFVMGMEPMDKYEEYVTSLKSMKIEEAIKIQQDAYDRFMAR